MHTTTCTLSTGIYFQQLLWHTLLVKCNSSLMQAWKFLYRVYQSLWKYSFAFYTCGILLSSQSWNTTGSPNYGWTAKAKIAFLDEIWDVHNGIGREHLVSIQDIQNIRCQYTIEGIQCHQNDHQSVDIWVQEMSSHVKCQPYNPMLLHKT